MRVLTLVLGTLGLIGQARGQVTQFVGSPANPTYYLDFDAPFVASGALAGNSSVFTSEGIASVTLIAPWSVGGDSITATSNASGQSLVSQGSALAVAGVGEALDGAGSGGGFDIRLLTPATTFGVLFIDQINFSYQVELFAGAVSLGSGSFSYSGNFPAPGHYWTGTGAFDRIKITFPSGAAGVGIDNLAFDQSTPPVPTPYCTSGTTTNGCQASITANAQPSVTFATACNVAVTSVEGQKTGIVFYGLAALPQPWCSMGGGTSFLCVKPPTMRTGPQSSGGVLGQCDGALALDWNAFQQANPSALGSPWSAGSKAYVQGWFRDAVSCKTTSLSNALELTYLP